MNRLLAALAQTAAALEQHGYGWALVGGLAVSARTEPRFTRDVELAVAVLEDRQAESLLYGLQQEGFRVLQVLEHETAGRLSTVRVIPPQETSESILVDLLFASSGIESEIVRDAERLELAAGLVVPVCRTGHLIALKLLARDDDRRPQDRIDLHALLRESPEGELQLAREAIRQITARGFHRGRELEAAFDRLLGRNSQ